MSDFAFLTGARELRGYEADHHPRSQQGPTIKLNAMSVLRVLVHNARRHSTTLPHVLPLRRFASSYNSNIAGLTDEQLEARHSLLVHLW